MYFRISANEVLLLCTLSWLIGIVSVPLIRLIIRICKTSFDWLQNRLVARTIKAQAVDESSMSEDETDTEGPDMKLVLCVRTDLEMGKGKIAAQCGHAALGAYTDSIYRNNPYLDAWMRSGQKKVVLKVKNHEDMMALRRTAIAANVNHHTTCDAGRTQIPAGSYTVIAIGPAPENVVDAITGHLKLL